MSSRDAGMRVRLATSTTTGSMSAATPMLFMNAESTAPVTMMTKISVTSRRPPRRMTWRPMMSAIPVRVRPSLRMNMAQTVMTALLLKPANAWSAVTRPVIASVPRTSSATRSMRMTSLINRTSETARMAEYQCNFEGHSVILQTGCSVACKVHHVYTRPERQNRYAHAMWPQPVQHCGNVVTANIQPTATAAGEQRSTFAVLDTASQSGAMRVRRSSSTCMAGLTQAAPFSSSSMPCRTTGMSLRPTGAASDVRPPRFHPTGSLITWPTCTSCSISIRRSSPYDLLVTAWGRTLPGSMRERCLSGSRPSSTSKASDWWIPIRLTHPGAFANGSKLHRPGPRSRPTQTLVHCRSVSRSAIQAWTRLMPGLSHRNGVPNRRTGEWS